MNHENNASFRVDRRQLLSGASALSAASVLASTSQARRRSGPQRVFVQLFLRGAMDGMTTVVPHADGDYYALRPTLAVPAPGASGGAIDLDGFFGLAPAAAPLLTPYLDGKLAFVHASGSTDPTRSHFEAFTKMEFGGPNLAPGAVQNGWLARFLSTRGGGDVVRGVGAGDVLPQTLAGAPRVLPIRDFETFDFPGKTLTAQDRAQRMADAYAPIAPPVGSAALDTFAAIDRFSTIDFGGYVPSGGASYPATELGKQFHDAAALIKAQQGVEVVTIDYGGWDHHANQGPLDGLMASMLYELSLSIEAFYLDLSDRLDEVLLSVVSEFGRRADENGSAGTDHGRGNVMMLLGDGVVGGQVHGTWPGLGPAQLDDFALAITTDYRDVLGEAFQNLMGATPGELAAMFPMHTYAPVGATV